MAEIVLTRTADEWLSELETASIPSIPINSPDELIEDEHLQAVGFWQEIDHPTEGKLRHTGIPTEFSKTPGGVRAHAPSLGEHNHEVLAEMGLSDARINELSTSGALYTANKK